jgi:hypothetical protein
MVLRLDAPEHDDGPSSPPGFASIDEMPVALLDPPPSEEGDDQINDPKAPRLPADTVELAHLTTKMAQAGFAQVPLPPGARARIVPLRRQLKQGMSGKDVVAVKRALSHAGYLRWPKRWSLVAGPKWRAAVVAFQRQYKLTADGVYGISTHRKLVGLGHFDKYGALLMAQAPRQHPADNRSKHRDRIEAYLLWAYHNRDRIDYLQRRPMHINAIWELPTNEDCSEFATRAYKAGGAPDPNGRGYDGQGYTGTLADHGMPGPMESAALNFYGSYPHHHVTVGVGSACMSMGSSPGPLLLPVRYRGDYNSTRVYPL